MSTAVLADPQSSALQVVKKINHIATLPEVTSRIIATVEDPNSNATTLHKVVSHDPALVTRILKIVNSAFYGLPGQIASVERAIVLLGLNAIKNIAVAASLGQLFKGVKLCDGFTAKDLWTHCVAVGVTARHLAKEMKIPLADEAFLAGMIHDVGLLVSLQAYPDQLRQTCDAARNSWQQAVGSGQLLPTTNYQLPTAFCDLERQFIGLDHQQLGQTLCDQWKFPRSCQLVAGYHHRPTTLDREHRLLVTLVHIADTLCCNANHGFNLTALHQDLNNADLPSVGLESAPLDALRANLPTLLSESATMFA